MDKKRSRVDVFGWKNLKQNFFCRPTLSENDFDVFLFVVEIIRERREQM